MADLNKRERKEIVKWECCFSHLKSNCLNSSLVLTAYMTHRVNKPSMLPAYTPTVYSLGLRCWQLVASTYPGYAAQPTTIPLTPPPSPSPGRFSPPAPLPFSTHPFQDAAPSILCTRCSTWRSWHYQRHRVIFLVQIVILAYTWVRSKARDSFGNRHPHAAQMCK